MISFANDYLKLACFSCINMSATNNGSKCEDCVDNVKLVQVLVSIF